MVNWFSGCLGPATKIYGLVQLISGAFEHSVLRIVYGFIRLIDRNVKHHIFQSIDFLYTQYGMFNAGKTQL